jgi:hypothetical protein
MTRAHWHIILVWGALAFVSLAFPGCGHQTPDEDPSDFFGNLSRWGHLQDEADRH